MSAEEWEGIPDVGDRTVKKRPRFNSFAAAPDSLLAKAAMASQTDSSISVDGLATPAGATTNADLTAIGANCKQLDGAVVCRCICYCRMMSSMPA